MHSQTVVHHDAITVAAGGRQDRSPVSVHKLRPPPSAETKRIPGRTPATIKAERRFERDSIDNEEKHHGHLGQGRETRQRTKHQCRAHEQIEHFQVGDTKADAASKASTVATCDHWCADRRIYHLRQILLVELPPHKSFLEARGWIVCVVFASVAGLLQPSESFGRSKKPRLKKYVEVEQVHQRKTITGDTNM